MLFDFQAFVAELREKEDKKQIVEKYEKLFWEIKWSIYDQVWYTEYLLLFPGLDYIKPEELKDDFDWELLQRLVIWSFSSDYELKEDKSKWWKELYIAVKSWDQSVVKTVSELWSFQVLRLYEIYVEEQMNLHALKAEDENEKNAIDQERSMRINRRKAVLETIDREALTKDAKKDQESKLWDLMWKL